MFQSLNGREFMGWLVFFIEFSDLPKLDDAPITHMEWLRIYGMTCNFHQNFWFNKVKWWSNDWEFMGWRVFFTQFSDLKDPYRKFMFLLGSVQTHLVLSAMRNRDPRDSSWTLEVADRRSWSSRERDAKQTSITHWDLKFIFEFESSVSSSQWWYHCFVAEAWALVSAVSALCLS